MSPNEMPEPTIGWTRWSRASITSLVFLTAGWMTFDGAHALVTGDFVTPRSGGYAGQLGPWAAIPRAVGIDPRGEGVKVFFVGFGLAYLAALGAFLAG